MLGNEEQVEEVQQRLWEDGISEYNKRSYKNPELFTEKFRPLIKKTFVPHMYRREVWPLLVEDILFIRKEYFNELVERLHLVPDRVNKSIARDLDRTLTQESNVVNPHQFKEDMALLLMLYHLHRPDISYVQGMTYPLAILLAVLDKFEAFRCFCDIMSTEFVSTLFCFDIQNVSLYCRVFDELLLTHDRKVAEHLQQINLRS